MIGGAISLAKNVPGIQRRSDDTWAGTAAEPRLTPGEVRELLLFQVLQFVSAPLLAVVAYHTIKPESFGTTVALGFIAGFASDQTLASIRNMLKAGQTPTGAQPLTGSIRGNVQHAGQPVQGASVTLGGTNLAATTDAKGDFSFLAVPVKSSGMYVVTISSGTMQKPVQVTLSAPTAVNLGTVTLPVVAETS